MEAEMQADLLEPTNPTGLPQKFSQKLTQVSSEAKAKEIAVYVQQCYDVLNVYGKDAEAMKNTQRAFISVLKPYSAQTIQKAFFKYLETGSSVPTPAQIKNICDDIEAEKSKPAPQPFQKKIIKQQIRDWATDDIIDIYQHGEHLSPFQVSQKYAGQRVYVRMSIE